MCCWRLSSHFKINLLCILPSERNPPQQTRICQAWGTPRRATRNPDPPGADGLGFISWKGSVACEGSTQQICSRGVFVKRWALPEVFLLNTGPWERCFCQTLGLGRASSDSGSLFDLGQVAFSFLYSDLPVCNVADAVARLFACSAVWHVVCQISQLRSGSPCATATEINSEHQECSLLTHPGLLSQNPPPLPVFTGG